MVRSVIERYFTKDLKNSESVEDLFEWKSVDIHLEDQNGNTIFEQTDCFFPEHYSQTACDIIASKYFYRGAGEFSLRQDGQPRW